MKANGDAQGPPEDVLPARLRRRRSGQAAVLGLGSHVMRRAGRRAGGESGRERGRQTSGAPAALAAARGGGARSRRRRGRAGFWILPLRDARALKTTDAWQTGTTVAVSALAAVATLLFVPGLRALLLARRARGLETAGDIVGARHVAAQAREIAQRTLGAALASLVVLGDLALPAHERRSRDRDVPVLGSDPAERQGHHQGVSGSTCGSRSSARRSILVWSLSLAP